VAVSGEKNNLNLNVNRFITVHFRNPDRVRFSTLLLILVSCFKLLYLLQMSKALIQHKNIDTVEHKQASVCLIELYHSCYNSVMLFSVVLSISFGDV